MLPVVAMCGQRCGLDMTATTAMPLAVRTGLARSLGDMGEVGGVGSEERKSSQTCLAVVGMRARMGGWRHSAGGGRRSLAGRRQVWQRRPGFGSRCGSSWRPDNASCATSCPPPQWHPPRWGHQRHSRAAGGRGAAPAGPGTHSLRQQHRPVLLGQRRNDLHQLGRLVHAVPQLDLRRMQGATLAERRGLGRETCRRMPAEPAEIAGGGGGGGRALPCPATSRQHVIPQCNRNLMCRARHPPPA